MTPRLPLEIGTIHFVGIGGIGMSGIAEVMYNLGYRVQGSDQAENANVARLRRLGIPVFIGHAAENVAEVEVLVISSAVKEDNPEVQAARQRLIPVVRRAEMLAELMRLKWCVSVAGTHGKTTTTSMVAAVLDAAQYDPTVINGGIINAYGTNARLGEGEWMVVEADESDGTFVKLPSTIAVVTNIDPEHLDYWGEFEKERAAFDAFVENVPFYGVAILCSDHAEVQALIGRVSDRRILTYGQNPQADVRAVDMRFENGGATFTALLSERLPGGPAEISAIHLPMPGSHNVNNALAAIAVAGEMEIAPETIREAFAGFRGVSRRFTKTGEAGGVTVIDDYGHHPVEIEAVLDAARQAYKGRIVAVVQPHRYTRLQRLFEDFCGCFNDADTVIVADVYAAGEEPIEGVTQDALIDGIRRRGHRNVLKLETPDDLARMVAEEAESGDVVICLGAGNITAWAQALPDELAALSAAERHEQGGAA